MPSTKKKRVSKKTKQSWRKHVDIKDVEEYLEDIRADERLGESYELLPDKALFQVDRKPFTKSQVSKKEKQSLDTLPRCFQILQPLTKVPDPISKRNRVRTKEERKSAILKSIEEKQRKQGIQKAKDKISDRNRTLNRAHKEASKNKFGEFNKDLWHVEDYNPVDADLHNEWCSNDTIRHTYRGLGKSRKRVPESLTVKHTVLPTVEIPHPGTSYNPSFKDHQALLREIADKEYKLIKEDRHIERVTSRMFKKLTPLQKEESWLVEMSEGLPKPDDENDDDSDGDLKSVNPPVKNQKKDRKQRRKQKEQQILERARHVTKQEKKKIADIYRLKMINKSIEKSDEKVKILQEKRQKVKQYKSLEPKRLGSNKFETPDLDFNMGEDIAGNLRGLKSEGNLLRDRFKSMQKRNILQPTVKQPLRKRAKVKRFEKSGHKMGWESKGY